MSQRLQFKCWNCPETYSLLRDTEGIRILLVKCPFCGAEAEVDLKPYESKGETILRGDKPQPKRQTLNLPAILPTQPHSQP